MLSDSNDGIRTKRFSESASNVPDSATDVDVDGIALDDQEALELVSYPNAYL